MAPHRAYRNYSRREAHVLELVRQTRNRKPERFAKTAVAPSDIGKLSSFLFKLSVFLNEVVKERARREPHEKIGSEESAELRCVGIQREINTETSIAGAGDDGDTPA